MGNSISISDGVGIESPSQARQPIHTPLRGGRSASPLGLTGGGFRGLYGGRENGDEERNWLEGARFHSAEMRLWNATDVPEHELRTTPEAEDWRLGRRAWRE